MPYSLLLPLHLYVHRRLVWLIKDWNEDAISLYLQHAPLQPLPDHDPEKAAIVLSGPPVLFTHCNLTLTTNNNGNLENGFEKFDFDFTHYFSEEEPIWGYAYKLLFARGQRVPIGLLDV